MNNKKSAPLMLGQKLRTLALLRYQCALIRAGLDSSTPQLPVVRR